MEASLRPITDKAAGQGAGSIRRLSVRGLGALLLTIIVLGFPTVSEAIPIRINTGNDGKAGISRGAVDPGVTWNYTGDFNDARFASYVDNDPFFPGPTTKGSCHMLGGNCRIGSNTAYGPDALAAGYPAYLGVQFFYLTFDLPSGATNVVLEVTEIGADDRVGLHLNGNEVNFWGNLSGAPVSGRIDGSDVYAGTPLGAGIQPSLNPVTLQSPFGFPDFSLTDPLLFNIGDTNVLRLWVNNTNSRSPFAPAQRMHPGDPSLVGFDALLSFEVNSVPEPGTLTIFGLGLIGLCAARRRNKRS